MKGVNSGDGPEQLGSNVSKAVWHDVMTAMAGQMRPSAYVATDYPKGPTHRIFSKPLVTGDTYDDQEKGRCMRPCTTPAPPFYYEEKRLQYHVPATKQVIRCHTIICFAAHGPPGKGDEVRHKMGECWFDDCLNPLHLGWGTKAENRRDYLIGPRRLGRRKKPDDKSGAKHGKRKTVQVKHMIEARRMAKLATTMVIRSASDTVQGVITRSKTKAE